MESEPELPDGLMLPDGTLNSGLVSKREILYRGMNGQAVERIYSQSGQSYIYKPLTNDEQWGKEKWVYDHVLPSFPPIYPKIVLSSFNRQTGGHAILFEDLGRLEHVFKKEVAMELAELMAGWHALDTVPLLDAPLRGPKPQIESIIGDLRQNQAETFSALMSAAIPETLLQSVYQAMGHAVFPFKPVISHGDLHAGNYAAAQGKLVVLDWEHAHLNSPLWDLYHMIDMSHPLFPKSVTEDNRNDILQAYLKAAGHAEYLSGEGGAGFIRQYMLFASIFSIWMIRLIQGDLAGSDGKWPREQLIGQLRETTESLKQCAAGL